MKQDSLNLMMYSICRKKTEIDLNDSCKNGSKYGPVRIKRVMDIYKEQNNCETFYIQKATHLVKSKTISVIFLYTKKLDIVSYAIFL